MKHLRKTIAAVTAVTALAALTGCGGGAGAESDGKIVLNYWNENDSGPPLELDQKLVQEFNDANPDIQVKLRNISNASFFTVMRNAFTSGKPPEIFAHEGNNNLFQFVVEDQVAPITDWWNKPGNGDRFTQGAPVSSVTYDGEVYGVPGGLVTTNQLYYNKKILADAGIDPTTLTTWDDFLAAFEQLKSDGITPIAYGNSEGWPGSQFFYDLLSKTAGATKINQLVARNCGYKWTDDDVVEAAQLYTDLADKGYFSEGLSSDDYTTATATFFSGRAAFFQGGSWVVPEIAESPDRDNYGLVTFPMVEGGKGSVTEGLISTGGLALSKSVDTDEEMDAALTFLDWMNQPEQQRQQVEIGNISAVTDANDPELTDPLIQQIIDEQIAPSTGSFPFLEHVLPKAVGEDAIWQGSIAVLTGQATPQSWMENVEKLAASEEPTVKVAEECS
jgi:raffinose/stachyose/melibiose transport system substrate-binding protein